MKIYCVIGLFFFFTCVFVCLSSICRYSGDTMVNIRFYCILLFYVVPCFFLCCMFFFLGGVLHVTY